LRRFRFDYKGICQLRSSFHQKVSEGVGMLFVPLGMCHKGVMNPRMHSPQFIVFTWLERLTTGRVEVIQRARIVVPLPQDDGTEVERRARKYGDFSAMNGLWNRSRSATTQARLRENPEEWAQYHTLYRVARKDWSVVPFEEFIRWAKQRSDYVIGDFG
jgi:hypothetical protein